jgi:hypothetical protein
MANPMISQRVIPLICSIIISIFLSTSLSAFSPVEVPEEKIHEELAKVANYYDARQYQKARSKLNEIEEIYRQSDGRYSQSVSNSIKYLDSLLKDRNGYFESFPSFSGKVKVIHWGAYSGYFEVRKGKKTMAFGWDAGIIIKTENGFDVGSFVKVYHDKKGKALKIIVNKKKSRGLGK